MKIVQAFNQQAREASASAEAVAIGSSRRPSGASSLRAIMTAIVIFLIFGAITMVIWQGAIDVAAGT
jgi:ATP-binding cassette subfamily B protein